MRCPVRAARRCWNSVSSYATGNALCSSQLTASRTGASPHKSAWLRQCVHTAPLLSQSARQTRQSAHTLSTSGDGRTEAFSSAVTARVDASLTAAKHVRTQLHKTAAARQSADGHSACCAAGAATLVSPAVFAQLRTRRLHHRSRAAVHAQPVQGRRGHGRRRYCCPLNLNRA